MNEKLKSKLKPISISELTTPKDGSIVMLDRWWITDGENVFVYNNHSLQCNRNENIARDIGLKLYELDVIFIPVAYCHDSSYA